MHEWDCLLRPHHFSVAQIEYKSQAQTLVCPRAISNLTPSWKKPAPANPTLYTLPNGGRGRLPQEHSRLWRCVQVRPGMRREEQPRQRVLFTEGSLWAEGHGDWAPALPLPFFPVPPTARLRSVSPPQDEPLRDGPLRVAVKRRQRLVLGVLRKDAVGGLGEGSGHSEPGRTRPPPGAVPTRTHLVQEAEPLEGLPVLHGPRHPRRLSAPHATVRRSRLSENPARCPRKGSREA